MTTIQCCGPPGPAPPVLAATAADRNTILYSDGPLPDCPPHPGLWYTDMARLWLSAGTNRARLCPVGLVCIAHAHLRAKPNRRGLQSR